MPASDGATLTHPVKELSPARWSWIGKGVRFVTTQTDLGFLLAAAGRWTGKLRAALSQPAR